MSLLRSTKFVRYFTGAARTLILNSAKTTEANLLVNPKTLSASNSTLLREYATSKKTENLEPLLQKLDAEVRRFGRITKRDIDEVFDEIQTKNNITSSQSLLVIRCCGELVPEELPEQRTLLVQKIWSVLTERGIPMDISHYNALLRVYLENEHPFSPAQFLEELEKKGLTPNRVTYQRLMWRYCQEGDVEGATKVLEKMRELNFPVSEPVLNALVMGHSYHGDTAGAKAVLETMAGAGLQPTNRTYTLLACGHARKGDLEGIENIIKVANEKDAFLMDKDILEIIEHLAVGGHGDKVDQLLPHLQKAMGYNQDVCNLILKLLNKGQDEVAKKMLSTMPKSTNIEDTIFKGAFFVKQLLKVNKSPEEIIKICKELQNEQLIPKALFIATEHSLQTGNIELAKKLFKELETEGLEIRSHYYWPLLAQKGRENDEEGLLQLLRDMSSKNIAVSGEALRDYVIPYMIKKDSPQNILLKLQLANVPTIHGARNLMIELLDSNHAKEAAQIAIQYRPRGQYSLVMRPLINALNKTKDIDSFVSILHVISSKAPTSQTEEESASDDAQQDDIVTNEIGRVLKSAIKILSKSKQAEPLLEAIHAKGLRINVETAEFIEQYLGEQLTSKISELLSQLTSSDLELAPLQSTQRQGSRPRNKTQLENLISQLKAKGENVNGLQKQLLIAYMADKDIPKLDALFDELKTSNFELTPITLAQMYEFYAENNSVDKANECKSLLSEKYPEFTLSRPRLVTMAGTLIQQNRFDEAIKHLEEHKIEGDIESNFMYKSKCWQILNYLAENKEPEKVKQLTNVLVSNNYVEPSNVLLGPSIKAHLLKDDIEGALKEFEHCCNQYRSTPWKGELMKALILKEDANKLQWLADLSTQIHGEVNILHDLVLAFVECGRLRQARRILETPGLQPRARRLDDACRRYVEDGKSEYLEGLLEATKELSHIDRSNIFYHLLVTYCKSDETDKALGLWTLLQEEGEIPGDQFLATLGDHLKTKNREVPFVVPLMEPPKLTKIEAKNKPENVPPPKSNVPTKKVISAKIETLIGAGSLTQAMDESVKSIKNGVVPDTKVIKYLLKNLAEQGDTESIEKLGELVTDSVKRRITYNDKLTLAIFNRGAGQQHIDALLRSVQNANTDEELETALKKFPRSNALASTINNDEILNKCKEVAHIAASKGNTTPANLLWLEFILAKKYNEADSLWNKCLTTAPSLVFRRLLQESHVRKEPELIEKLISCLKTNLTVPKSSIGNAYSRLINFYVSENNIAEAENAVEDALKSGADVKDINSSTLKRLKGLVEATGKEFKYA